MDCLRTDEINQNAQLTKVIADSKKKSKGIKKKVWSKEEDGTLIEYVNSVTSQDGKNKCSWSQVASFVKDRTGKQCRERWHNYLKGDLKKGEWTASSVIARWCKIATELEGRSDNAVKNRWYSLTRFYKKRGDSLSSRRNKDNQIENIPKKDTNQNVESGNKARVKYVNELKKSVQQSFQQAKSIVGSNASYATKTLRMTENKIETPQLVELDEAYGKSGSDIEDCAQESRQTESFTESKMRYASKNLKMIEDKSQFTEWVESGKVITKSDSEIQQYMQESSTIRQEIDSIDQSQRIYASKRLKTKYYSSTGDQNQFQANMEFTPEFQRLETTNILQGSSPKERHDTNVNRTISEAEPSSYFKTPEKSLPELLHTPEHYPHYGEYPQSAPKSEHLNQEFFFYTPSNAMANFLSPVKPNNASPFSSLVLTHNIIPHSQRINLNEWFKEMEEGPSLGVDVGSGSLFEILSPAPIRFRE